MQEAMSEEGSTRDQWCFCLSDWKLVKVVVNNVLSSFPTLRATSGEMVSRFNWLTMKVEFITCVVYVILQVWEPYSMMWLTKGGAMDHKFI
jgi:hypothetical protein